MDLRRIEDLVSEKVAAAVLQALGDRLAGLSQKMERQIVDKAARRLADRYFTGVAEGPACSMTELVADRAAKLVLQNQKQEAREAERHRMVRAIRSPKTRHLLDELKTLAASEAAGQVKGAQVPLLNTAFKEFGSYELLLREVESPTTPG